ncbi:MAG: hypothetical protein ACRDRL_32795, partial [Sciscionella sp.]
LVADHDLDADTWAALRAHYDEQQMIELCMLVSNYAMIAGVLKSLRVPLEGGSRHRVGDCRDHRAGGRAHVWWQKR